MKPHRFFLRPLNSTTYLSLILCFLLLLLFTGCEKEWDSSTGSEGSVGTHVGQTAIDFTLLDQDGMPVSLYDYQGLVILIDFSFLNCAGCVDQAMHGEQLYQTYRSRGFVILTILIYGNEGGPAMVEDCEEWADMFGLTHPVLADTAQDVWNLYDDTGFNPLSLIIDRNMTIQYKDTGYNSSVEQQFRALIETLL